MTDHAAITATDLEAGVQLDVLATNEPIALRAEIRDRIKNVLFLSALITIAP